MHHHSGLWQVTEPLKIYNRQVQQQMAKCACFNPQTNTNSVPVLGRLSIKMQQVVLQISEPPCIQTLVREKAAYQLWAEWKWRLGVNAESGRMGYTQSVRERRARGNGEGWEWVRLREQEEEEWRMLTWLSGTENINTRQRKRGGNKKRSNEGRGRGDGKRKGGWRSVREQGRRGNGEKDGA